MKGMNNILDRNSYEPLSRQVYAALRSDILNSKYKSGVLLNERELASAFGISRTPVRESLRMLETEGIVEFVPRQGYAVVGLSREETSHLYKIRELLMSYVVEFVSSSNIPEENLKQLRNHIELGWKYVENDDDIDKFLKLCDELDNMLVKFCKSRVIANMLDILCEYSGSIRRMTVKDKKRREEIWKEHQQIIEAIESKDPKLAREIMMAHVTKGRESFED